MSLASRDQEAFDVLAARAFGDTYVVSLELEMQARRLTLTLYGTLRVGDAATFCGKVTFFGASALRFENESGDFPESAGISSLDLTYQDAEGEGGAEVRGRRAWAMSWSFEGLAYEEQPAVFASLADDVP